LARQPRGGEARRDDCQCVDRRHADCFIFFWKACSRKRRSKVCFSTSCLPVFLRSHRLMHLNRLLPVAALLALSCIPTAAAAQRNQNLTPEEREKLITKRNAIEQELESAAIIDRKV